jgi:S-adenosylmethionine hydrolase
VERLKPSGIVTLTTDFGLADHYVGAMKGVILAAYPAATIVDITHGVEPYQIEQGAFFLRQAYAAFPAGTVHVAVVDPGVGTARRSLTARTSGHYFVAPDNGLLSHVAWDAPTKVHAVEFEQVIGAPMSRTFHGRDVFAPLGARIAMGEDPTSWGSPIEDYVLLRSLEPERRTSGRWRGRVLNVDRFGNLVTSLRPELVASLEGDFVLRVGEAEITRLAEAYDDIEDEEPFLIAGSAGFLEVSVRQGSAAESVDAWLGDEVELEDNSLS